MGDTYYAWYAYGSDRAGSLKDKLRATEHYLTNKLGQIRDKIDELNKQTNIVNSDHDFSLVEESMYVQMLMLVGRVDDAKKVAKDWISNYELSNKLREPTPEEKKKLDKEMEELKKALEIAKNTPPVSR